MKLTIMSVAVLLSLSTYSQVDYLNDQNIDCFANARNTRNPVYTIAPGGQYDAQLLYPINTHMVVEGFEEESESDPDFFNSGSCLTAEENSQIQSCGSEKSSVNGLLAIRARNTGGASKVVYCEDEISTYVQGVPTTSPRWRWQRN